MNDLSWVPALRTDALTFLFTNVTLLGYQVFPVSFSLIRVLLLAHQGFLSGWAAAVFNRWH